MSEGQPNPGTGETCPKRVWVMTTLADDEQVSTPQALPRGLEFHLSRCAACRALADDLLAVRRGLDDLSALEPDTNLAEKAEQQLAAALQAGAEPTGRVDLSELDEADALDEAVPTTDWVNRLRPILAAAAALLIAVGLFWMTRTPANRVPVVESNPLPSRAAPTGKPQRRLAEAPSRPPSPVVTDPAEDADPMPGEATVAVREPVPPRRFRFYSHVEAAECDDDTYIHRAVILPDPVQRNLSWRAPLDKPPPIESTGYLPKDN